MSHKTIQLKAQFDAKLVEDDADDESDSDSDDSTWKSDSNLNPINSAMKQLESLPHIVGSSHDRAESPKLLRSAKGTKHITVERLDKNSQLWQTTDDINTYLLPNPMLTPKVRKYKTSMRSECHPD